MKKLTFAILALVLVASAHATNKTVTNVGATVSTVLTPSNAVTIITIQNTGSGAVRLGIDGGTTNRQKSTPDPTASSGYHLAAGAQLIITRPGNVTVPQIRAILETATTTTLEITTDDPFSV